jgi:hypothetical protein
MQEQGRHEHWLPFWVEFAVAALFIVVFGTAFVLYVR